MREQYPQSLQTAVNISQFQGASLRYLYALHLSSPDGRTVGLVSGKVTVKGDRFATVYNRSLLAVVAAQLSVDRRFPFVSARDFFRHMMFEATGQQKIDLCPTFIKHKAIGYLAIMPGDEPSQGKEAEIAAGKLWRLPFEVLTPSYIADVLANRGDEIEAYLREDGFDPLRRMKISEPALVAA